MLGCQPADDLPPLRFEGEVLSYATDEDLCEGTVDYGERWMTAVGARLGISRDQIFHTTYYQLDPEDVTERCGAVGCTRIVDGEIRIFDSQPLRKHELVHALHLSAWRRGRPLLTEGLATVFEESNPVIAFGPGLDIDVDEQLEIEHAEPDTYVVGRWIVYWIVRRHGLDAFRDFWQADVRGSSAEEFRDLFEQHFGESLDAMLADVSGQPTCTWLTCIEDVVEWQGDFWATESPASCGDGPTVGIGSTLERGVLIEVPASGTYTVSISPSDLGSQGALIHPCSDVCGSPTWVGSFYAGTTSDVLWDAGLYRVTTAKLGVDDPGVRVEIRAK